MDAAALESIALGMNDTPSMRLLRLLDAYEAYEADVFMASSTMPVPPPPTRVIQAIREVLMSDEINIDHVALFLRIYLVNDLEVKRILMIRRDRRIDTWNTQYAPIRAIFRAFIDDRLSSSYDLRSDELFYALQPLLERRSIESIIGMEQDLLKEYKEYMQHHAATMPMVYHVIYHETPRRYAIFIATLWAYTGVSPFSEPLHPIPRHRNNIPSGLHFPILPDAIEQEILMYQNRFTPVELQSILYDSFVDMSEAQKNRILESVILTQFPSASVIHRRGGGKYHRKSRYHSTRTLRNRKHRRKTKRRAI